MTIKTSALDQLATLLDRSDDGLTVKVKQEDTNAVTVEWWADPEDDDRPSGVYAFTLDNEIKAINSNILNFDAEYRSVGFYRKLNGLMTPWLRDLGIEKARVPMLAERNGEFHRDLVDTGYEEVEEGIFEQDISDPATSRMDQYTRWVNGEDPEPQWHKDLPDDFRVTKKV